MALGTLFGLLYFPPLLLAAPLCLAVSPFSSFPFAGPSREKKVQLCS